VPLLFVPIVRLLIGYFPPSLTKARNSTFLLLRSFQTKLRGWLLTVVPSVRKFRIDFLVASIVPAFVAVAYLSPQQKQHSYNTVSNCLVDLIEIKLNPVIYPCITCLYMLHFFVMGPSHSIRNRNWNRNGDHNRHQDNTM